MRTIHLVSHTHWDREWYRTFQQFRLRLVHLVDGLLDILATDPAYKHFTLDGQTIVLDDYLQIRPEAEPVLRELVRSGRLEIGPWHILPDMFLVSPEAHIRNLLEGERRARRFGHKMMIGYMPDSFGHIGQMPQVLRGFGIDNACLWRGLDEQPAELWWQAPDGSRVLLLYLRDSYSNGAALNAGVPAEFTEQVRRAADSLAPHSALSELLIMFGTDHMEPPRQTSAAISFANQQMEDYCIVHSTLPDYLAAVQLEIAARNLQLPTVAGELRSARRSHLLPGVLSTRIWIKQRNQACENLLEKWAEPFTTFASLAGAETPRNGRLTEPAAAVREAWRMLLECHPHDSICGCSTDQVHEEMRPRFDQVQQVGEELTRQSLEALANVVDTRDTGLQAGGPEPSAVVVFNPSSNARTDVATSDVILPAGLSEFELVDEDGNVVPHQSGTGQSAEVVNVRVRREELAGLLAMVHQGRAGNLAIRALHWERTGADVRVEAVFVENGEPDLKVWEEGLTSLRRELDDPGIEYFHIHARTPEAARVTFAAADVPPLGWRTFHVRATRSQAAEIELPWAVRLAAPLAELPIVQGLLRRLGRGTERPPYVISNDRFVVELDRPAATLTVSDQATGTRYAGLNRFIDSGDGGDTYNFSPPLSDSRQDRARVLAVEITRGAVLQRMSVSLVLRVPASLSDDRTSRSRELVALPITTTITLTNGVPRVDIHTEVENRARDHRLRVHFPAPFKVRSALHDGHFEIVERPVGVPASDGTWIEQPRPEVPQREFTTIAGEAGALTIANRGLPEVEVLNGAEETGSEIALTLLRCVGWLSRDDFSTRQGHAGPLLETPLAQMPGKWGFDYSVILTSGASEGAQQARGFAVPLRATATANHAGSLSASGSFVHVDHAQFVVTAVKQAEDRSGWLVRGYNTGDEAITLRLRPWRRFQRAARTNLAEQVVSDLEVGPHGEAAISVRGHEIVSVLFSDRAA